MIQGHQYTCKCSISDEEITFILGDDYITIVTGKKGDRQILYSEIQAVHLSHAPSKHNWNSYMCRITMKNGKSLQLCNKSYDGIFKIKDRSNDYTKFLKELHKKLSVNTMTVNYFGGFNSMADYIGLVIGLAFFIGLAVLLLNYGKHGVVVGLIIPISWLIWLIATFIKNRPVEYKPLDISSRLLPKNR